MHRIRCLTDQPVAEQPDRPGAFSPCLLLVLGAHAVNLPCSIHSGSGKTHDMITITSGATRVDQHAAARSGQPGANNLPPETTAATPHGDTVTTNRRITDTVTASITVTASAHALPADAGITGSGSSARNHTVNTARTDSSRPAKRRNQPRTVSAGRDNTAAIHRCPSPTAFAASAAPITTAASARRSNATTGNNTCVTPQPTHRDRRGRVHNGPSGPRNIRRRACPHPVTVAEHPGHLNRPAANRRSTSAASTPTVITAPPCATARPSRTLRPETTGGPSPTST
jgi:hypothetical protein